MNYLSQPGHALTLCFEICIGLYPKYCCFVNQFKFPFAESVHQLKINASYTTSFQCFDGSYALISGDTLTLEYDFGFSYKDVSMRLSNII